MKLPRPYLDFWLDLGFISVQTGVMRVQVNQDIREYVSASVVVFRRWGFRFRLYHNGLQLYQAGRK